MKARQAKIIQSRILSNLQTLKMLKSQFGQQIIKELPSCCKRLNHLSRMLKVKNNQVSFLKIKSRKAKEHNTFTSFLQLQEASIKARIRQQLDYVKKNLKIQSNNLNSKQQISLNAITSISPRQLLSSEDKQKNNNILDYLQVLGCSQALDLARAIGISNQFNMESNQQLAECFNQMISFDRPINLFQRKQTINKVNIKNIVKYQHLLDEIINLPEQSTQNFSLLIQLATSNIQKNSILQLNLRSNPQFDFLLHQMLSYVSLSQYNSNRYILIEYKRLQKSIHNFSRDKAKQKKFQGQFSEQDLWQKILYFFMKGNQFNDMIIVHLQQYGQIELLKFFKAVIAGKNYQFRKDDMKFNQNKDYRTFILLLERKCLEYYLQNNQDSAANKELICITLKQIQLKHRFNEMINLEKDFIKKYCEWRLQNFHSTISKQKSMNKEEIVQLFSLGQYVKTLQLLYDYEKIDAVHYLILLSILCQLDLRHSDLLFYSHEQNIRAYIRVIKQILNVATRGQEIFYKIILAFAPVLRSLNKQTSIKDILLVNQVFFQQIFQKKGYLGFSKALGLDFTQISTILSKSIQKYNNYVFCLQLSLSSCLQLQKAYIICSQLDNKYAAQIISQYSRASKNNYNRKQLKNQYRQYQNKQINILKGMSNLSLKPSNKERLMVLYQGCKLLIKLNISMLNNTQNRQKYYDKLSFINNLYLKLKQSKIQSIIWECLQKIENNQQKIQIQAKIILNLQIISLTYDTVTLKIAIEQKIFETIVQCLNRFIQQISDQLASTLNTLSETCNSNEAIQYIIIYLSEIAQSIMFFKQCKPKKYRQNRFFIQAICNQILNFLPQITSNSQVKQLKKVLEFILKEMNI